MRLARITKILICLLLSACIVPQTSVSVPVNKIDYTLAVYYFPGWTETPGAWWNPPWEKIKPFPEREPLLGRYRDGSPDIALRHTQWMSAYGIDVVIYDWYWKSGKVHLAHSISAFMDLPSDQTGVEFAIMWANHSKVPESESEYRKIVQWWIDEYFSDPRYFRVDNKPVVMIFDVDRFAKNAKLFGSDAARLLQIANDMYSVQGGESIYFVGHSQAISHFVKRNIPRSGYSAISAYNYHKGMTGEFEPGGRSTSYLELVAGYSKSWRWILDNSNLPYWVPVTSGWDKRPWGSNTPHDQSSSTVEEFEQHLLLAKDLVDAHPEKTMKTVVICCWNEFGEGSYIEPTARHGFKYLESIKRTFESGADK